MARTYYIQQCRICGRSLRIRVEYLGRTLSCPHCRGTLEAIDSCDELSHDEQGGILRRAEELLSAVRSQSESA